MAQERTGLYGGTVAGNRFKRYLAEFVGTALFLGIGMSTVTSLTETGHVAPGFIALAAGVAFGAGLMLVVTAFGPISDAHFNPAVTIVMLLARKITFVDAVCYLASQWFGAVLGAKFAGIFGPVAVLVPSFRGLSFGSAFLIEAAGGFVLYLVIIRVTSDARVDGPLNPVYVGAALGVCVTVAANYTGGSFNPVRAFGPAYLAGGTPGLVRLFGWAPIFGMAAAHLFDRYVSKAKAPSGAEASSS